MDMNLSPDNAAQYTLELYWDYEIPVNIARVCAVSKTMDVLMVDKDSLNGLDARLDCINGRWIAKIAKGFEQQRERFTLSHLYYCRILGYGVGKSIRLHLILIIRMSDAKMPIGLHKAC